jgi:hypothetical protein
MLNALGHQFPGYHTEGAALTEASIAVCAMAGALGAHMLMRDPSGRLLEKFVHMLQTQTEHFAQGSVKRMNDMRSKMI